MLDDSPDVDAHRGVPGVLLRAVQLLRCFDADTDTLTARQLVERSELPRSTVHRMTADLVNLGLLTRSGNGRYAIGSLVWELGHVSHIHLRLRQAAQVHLTRLYDACGENVFLTVMSTDAPELAEALTVGQLRGPRSVPVDEREGKRSPLSSTSLGHALVSVQSDEWLERYIARATRGIGAGRDESAADLRRQIAAARNLGHATMLDDERAAVAVPIPSGDAFPDSSMGIVAARERWDEHRLVPLLKMTALAIAKDLARPLSR
ncbi:IclR family transcriptional regulator [Pseudoclavibacter endophyticus]|uniref:Helix-turn-helix domain-containing protein n=1 Tax=Pseudoclavibacter endophyticus TaxID=1778590 RepID=A0A6H9WGE7_9MICO|nr:helix-turn-helix domain-containing protein [Pseudoclavibacter endophyticus]KAB1646671.1 helix-turn-helix domain-containing protein [Pseudoclavibacter endophyticus]GGA76614.1 IclR family transcriptional regulator [Pseudoclavibacter endophyticus]